MWAGRKEPGTQCLHMLSFPRIFGNLEIPVTSARLATFVLARPGSLEALLGGHYFLPATHNMATDVVC